MGSATILAAAIAAFNQTDDPSVADPSVTIEQGDKGVVVFQGDSGVSVLSTTSNSAESDSDKTADAEGLIIEAIQLLAGGKWSSRIRTVPVAETDREVARIKIMQAERLAPGYYRVHVAWGIYWSSVGETAKAEAAYRKAIQVDPAAHEALHNLGLLLVEAGSVAEGVQFIERAMSLSGDPNYRLSLGEIRLGTDPISAEAVALDLTREHPGYAAAWSLLGRAQIANGKIVDAEVAFRRSTVVDPLFTDGLVNLGRFLRLRGRADESEIELARALEVDPSNIDGIFEMGCVRLAQDDRLRAKECFRRALEVDSRHAASLFKLGMLLWDDGNLPQARGLLERLAAVEPDAVSLLALAALLIEIGEEQKADELASRVAAFPRLSAGEHFELGKSLFALRRREEANKAFENALESGDLSPSQSADCQAYLAGEK